MNSLVKKELQFFFLKVRQHQHDIYLRLRMNVALHPESNQHLHVFLLSYCEFRLRLVREVYRLLNGTYISYQCDF
jgi:hypothetical protein